MLQRFYKSLDNILTLEQPLISQLQMLRDQLYKSLKVEEFRLECLEHVLKSIYNSDESWNAPPIFYNDQLKFSVRIIFWPAFYENNPHQHKTWSVTGVFHNHLTINIYELLEDPARLKKQRSIAAEVGEVGYLIPGCIHSVNNVSHKLSASMHIFNNVLDASHPENNAIWYPSPRKYNLSNGLKDRALITCLAIASNMKTQKSFEIINQIYREASNTIKLMAIESMYSFDHIHARKCFDKLELCFQSKEL